MNNTRYSCHSGNTKDQRYFLLYYRDISEKYVVIYPDKSGEVKIFILKEMNPKINCDQFFPLPFETRTPSEKSQSL